jgi:cytosine/adenosine deaminase-related metal-dependent hydrolase
MRKISADKVYSISGEFLDNTVVVTDNTGVILKIADRSEFDKTELEIYNGVLVPGFVNAHCHLELSHMKAKVDTGTGLIDFIKSVVTKRNVEQEIILEAIEKAEQEMLDAGIVAVGDISNVPDTFSQKSKGNLKYYSFVEFFDFLQNQNAVAEYEKYKAVYDALPLAPGSKKSCVPHAPYSVSEKLFALINEANSGEIKTISIHNQETPPENELFLKGSGAFVDFYGQFGISLDSFQPNGRPAIHYALQNMDSRHRTLFVHNTLTTADDIRFAQNWNPNVFWASCPNANLYIENSLPNYNLFIETAAKVCLGTDSLTSNWQLSILSEMQAIAKYQSYVTDEILLSWATLNGAQALGFDDELGSFEVGKKPGINLLYGFESQERIIGDTTRVKRLI